ncbi:MAG: M23 family metallopeptidase [Anaerolineae bacterium]
MRRLIAAGLMLALAACAPNPGIPATPTKTPVALVDDERPAATSIPTALPPTANTTDIPTTVPTETTTEPAPEPTTATPVEMLPPPTIDGALPAETYCMIRPIPEGWRDFLDRTYAYGSTSGGQLRPHTGGEFWNPSGTPVVAVGNGAVVHAGNDWETAYGPDTGFYGNLIILRLDTCPYNGRPVYALYGHLSEIYVETEQTVPQGEIIGTVGGTGVANGGPHLHFEVRVDDPTSYFTSTRNPDLWIRPYFGYGTLAGRVVDAEGNYLREVALTIRGEDAVRYTWTYAGDENIGDDAWGENFTYGDLPEGWYTVTTRSERRTYSEQVYINPGQTTWLEIVFD